VLNLLGNTEVNGEQSIMATHTANLDCLFAGLSSKLVLQIP